MTKRQQNKLDNAIDEIVRRRLSGVQINIMDISKVFKAGYDAVASGESLEDAVVMRYNELRQN